jgi:hypothetical protein
MNIHMNRLSVAMVDIDIVRSGGDRVEVSGWRLLPDE